MFAGGPMPVTDLARTRRQERMLERYGLAPVESSSSTLLHDPTAFYPSSCLSSPKKPPTYRAMARRSALIASSFVALACVAAAPALANQDEAGSNSAEASAPTETTGPVTASPSTTDGSTAVTDPTVPADPAAETGDSSTSVAAADSSAPQSDETGSSTSAAGDTSSTSAATNGSAAEASDSKSPPTSSEASTTTIDPFATIPNRTKQAPAEGWPIRPIVFPVVGPVQYWDGWGDYRGTIPGNFHIGVDIVGTRMQPLVAATNGTINHIVNNHRTAGWGLVIKDDEGWDYRYYHMNNDAPGTDDGSNPVGWRFAPGVGLGSRVVAGQLIGYMGDSGDSEGSVPHLHFEIHRPTGEPVNPFPSVRAAEKPTRCAPPEGHAELPNFSPPTDTDAAIINVPAFSGYGMFQISANGTVFRIGSARNIGMASFNTADGACPSA